MARTQTITDEQILEAAREIFFESGLQATTAQIAEHAGISEGTIFRRFPTKHKLFLAAMGLPEEPSWFETLEHFQQTGGEEVRTNLTRLANEIIDFFEDLLPKISMVMASGLQQFNPFEGCQGPPPPVRGLKALAGYIDREQRAGRVRPCDAEIVAKMYLGALQHYAFSELMGLHDYMPMPRKTYVRGVVDTLLRGIEMDPDE